jgi:DNA polymerase-4
MPMARARRLCPKALIIPPRFDRYQEVSGTVMQVLSTFSPEVEPISLDEAFLDMTGCEPLFGGPERMTGLGDPLQRFSSIAPIKRAP